MASRIFTLEALAAKHGDCLLLHWGGTREPRLLVIDGGPGGVYRAFLRKRLEALRASRGSPLAIDLLMVSHVDDDHINGVLDLTEEIEEDERAGREPHYRIDGLWFNSFDDVLGNAASLVRATARAPVSPEHRDAAATIASVGQGRSLRRRAETLGMIVNGGDLLVTDGWIWDYGDGLTLQVLGPRQQRIDEFREAWDKELVRRGWDVRPDLAEVAAFVDRSPWNLASTVVVAKVGRRRILLTGDARGDDILDGLREGGLLTGATVRFDVLKVPHHGSDRNVSTEFFRTVEADHYVISGNGEHHNPDTTTLEMIVAARGDARYTVHCTYRRGIKGLGERLDAFLAALPAERRERFVFRDESELGLRLDLGARLPD